MSGPETDVDADRAVSDSLPGMSGLRRDHLIAGVVHLVQAGLMLALSNDLALPVTASYLTDDPVNVPDEVVATELFTIPIGPLVALFLFLAAIDHLAVAAPGISSWYERRLRSGVNPARWIEYSFSASLMVVLIAMFVGIRDVAAIIGLVAANSSMILFGWLMERHQRPGSADWAAYWFGCIAGLAPWLAIGWYVVGTDEVPGFVFAITITQFVLFCGFALNQVLQFGRVGPWSSTVTAERGYVVLSLVAKSLLAWIVFANVLRI